MTLSKKSFNVFFSAAGAVIALASLSLRGDELDIARQALRDGLYEVARNHIGDNTNETARLVVLESFAKEGKWSEVAKTLKKCGGASPAFEYYRAVLRGEYETAAKLMKEAGDADGLAEALLLEAEAKESASDHVAAASLWRQVIAISNVSLKAYVESAIALGEIVPLEKAWSKSERLDAPLRRRLGLRLGVLLARDEKRLPEGEKILRSIVKENPDTVGAMEAMIAFSASEAAVGHWMEASKDYAAIMEVWPESMRRFEVQQGAAEASRRLGRREEAFAAAECAEKLASDDEERAEAILLEGDVLVDLGEGTKAMERYRRLLGEYPETRVAVALKKVLETRELEASGRELYRQFRFAEAAEIFRKVALADPSRRQRMEYFIMLCLYGQGLDDEAVKAAEALSEKADDFPIQAEATLWLAKYNFNRSEWKASIKDFLRFAELDRNHAFVPEALLWAAKAAFADADFPLAIQLATRLAAEHPKAAAKYPAFIVQGEALMEETRYDAAVLVFESVASAAEAPASLRLEASVLKCDALFALGADNSECYTAALKGYFDIRLGGGLDEAGRLKISFKIARTLDKLKRMNEAIDEYYTNVLLAYRNGRIKGTRFDDVAQAAFSKAAFRLADEFESHGREMQAIGVLNLVAGSDVPAAEEAEKRIDRISMKGKIL